MIIPVDVAVGDPTKASNQNAQTDAIADLNARVSVVSGQGVANGSFEFDLDTDGEPDAWTITDFSGGTHSLDTSTESDGEQSLKCVTTAGGGFVESVSDDFIAVMSGIRIEVPFAVKVSVASVRVRTQLLWYNDTQSLIGTTTLYDSTANSTSFQYFKGGVVQSSSPANAKYYKVKLIAGVSGGSVAANVWFDFLKSGIFRGSIAISSATKASITTDTTTVISVNSNMTDSNAGFATCQIATSQDFGSHRLIIQGWINGAWSNVRDFNPAQAKEYTIDIPLNESNQFNIISSVTSGDTSTVLLTGITV